MQLLNRFYDLKSGEIMLGQDQLTQKDLPSLRNMIGYVSQEPVLILGTIRDNMMFGNRDASEQDIREALEHSNAWEFVDNLPDKIDTYVGSGSVLTLSGG